MAKQMDDAFLTFYPEVWVRVRRTDPVSVLLHPNTSTSSKIPTTENPAEKQDGPLSKEAQNLKLEVSWQTKAHSPCSRAHRMGDSSCSGAKDSPSGDDGACRTPRKITVHLSPSMEKVPGARGWRENQTLPCPQGTQQP